MPNTNYLTSDPLGSPSIVTGKNGEVLSRRDFLPFGEEIAASEANRKAVFGYAQGNANTTRQSFTGYEKDTETDLEFAENRYYSNKLGRFTSVDPLMASASVFDAQSWNRYAYVRNNPLNLTDPLGLIYGTKEGTSHVIYYKDRDSMLADGATEVAAYFYQVGSTIYVLHPTQSLTTIAATFEEAARILANNWGVAIGTVSAAWAYAGLSAAVLPAVLAAGAVALQIACGTKCPQKAETFHQNYSIDLARVSDWLWGDDFFKSQGVYSVSSESDSGAGSSENTSTNGQSSTGSPNQQDPNKPTYKPNSGKHGKKPRGNIGAEPTNGQSTLDNSIQIKDTSPGRIGVDREAGEIVVFRHDGNIPPGNVYHGYVSTWKNLHQDQKNALIKTGLVTKKGKIK